MNAWKQKIIKPIITTKQLISNMLNVLDLFSGIGGFSLGVELAGWRTLAFCEIEESCRQILKNHWSHVPVFEDATKLTANDLPQGIDVICGGFPCQDISVAGKKAGITGVRSGLWKQFARLIDELEPRYAIIENVANLRSNGFITVLQDLWQVGYDAEWHCIPACALGAPHQRDRIWIIAYPNRERCSGGRDNRQGRRIPPDQKRLCPQIHQERGKRQPGAGPVCPVLADPLRTRLEGYGEFRKARQILGQEAVGLLGRTRGAELWAAEPNIPRLADGRLNPDWVEWLMGFPVGWTAGTSRKNRIKGLGNAVLPIIPELIARCINEYEQCPPLIQSQP